MTQNPKFNPLPKVRQTGFNNEHNTQDKRIYDRTIVEFTLLLRLHSQRG